MKALSAVTVSLAIVLAFGSASEADEPVVAGQNDVPAPKKTKTVLPEYPPEAQARGQRGIVIVELLIDPQGKVSSAQVIRSIPPFDEAALAAVRQWEYEVTRVNGKPVSVKLTVPITFAMRIPEIASRQEGIPELRAGAFPPLPPDAQETASATAEVTLGSEGNVEELRIVEGPPAYADSLARALRTWRFAPESSDATVTFLVHAQFNPSAKGSGSKVEFRLDGLRRSESLATGDSEARAPGATPAATPGAAPAAAAPAPATPPELPAAANPPPAPPPAVAASPASPPTAVTAAPTPSATAAMPAVSPPAPPATASYPAPTAASGMAAPSSSAVAARPAVTAPAPQVPAPTKPQAVPVEVLSVPPPPEPPENGLSAIRDVTLTAGVPDLTRGRRPVPPPFARMAQATGTIDVAFSVDAAGIASVKGSTGPDIFKRAAEQAVSSWTFRRTRADRIFLLAEFKYATDSATATVRPDVK